jgi:hypothetical protein
MASCRTPGVSQLQHSLSSLPAPSQLQWLGVWMLVGSDVTPIAGSASGLRPVRFVPNAAKPVASAFLGNLRGTPRKGDQRPSHTSDKRRFRQRDIGTAASVTAIAYISCCPSDHGLSSSYFYSSFNAQHHTSYHFSRRNQRAGLRPVAAAGPSREGAATKQRRRDGIDPSVLNCSAIY